MQISRDELEDLIDEPYFSRGQTYFEQGIVNLISIKPEEILAIVSGTEDYIVGLTREDEELDGGCSCPAFEDFGPCKHMAAAGLALLDRNTNLGYDPSDEYYKKLESELSKQSKGELISLVLRLAKVYPETLELFCAVLKKAP